MCATCGRFCLHKLVKKEIEELVRSSKEEKGSLIMRRSGVFSGGEQFIHPFGWAESFVHPHFAIHIRTQWCRLCAKAGQPSSTSGDCNVSTLIDVRNGVPDLVHQNSEWCTRFSSSTFEEVYWIRHTTTGRYSGVSTQCVIAYKESLLTAGLRCTSSENLNIWSRFLRITLLSQKLKHHLGHWSYISEST